MKRSSSSTYSLFLSEQILIESSSDEEEKGKLNEQQQRKSYTRQQLIEIAENLKDTFPSHLQSFYEKDQDAYFVINREVFVSFLFLSLIHI